MESETFEERAALLRHRTALILYGSETGNAHDVAEQIRDTTERLRFTSQIRELDSINLNDLLKHQVVIIAISTTGQGELPANAQRFWRSLRSVRLQPGCLRRLQFTSFGLGDTSYPKFNWAHRKLCNRLTQLGAATIYERGESDEQHPEGVDGTFVPWLTDLRSRLLELFPLPVGVEAIPDQVLLQPKWLLELDDIPATSIPDGLADNVSLDLPPIPGSVEVEVVSNDRVTPPDHWQDVRHLVLSTDQRLEYNPGDVLAIHPKNFPEDISNLLDILGWASVADKPLKLVPNHQIPLPSSYPPPPLSNLPTLTTLRALFTTHLDPISIPRRSFFSLLAHFTDDAEHKERLLEFADPANLDDLYDYTTRPRRSILESLADFPSLKLPWQWACTIFPALRPRQFSIASGGQLKYSLPLQTTDAAVGTRFELLVAIVKYKTVIRRIRQGVCTRYIASLSPGDKLDVVLQKGSLAIKPDELMQRPLVMVGPGTGVAPCRSLIFEKRALFASQGTAGGSVPESSSDTLFFGCRNEQSDYFFQNEWKSLEGAGGLDVFAAFSRDQRQKVYVQDLVRQQAELVYNRLEERNGLVYICGSSGKMPQAVREALIEVFQKCSSRSREEAEAMLVKLEKEGRYKQETW